MMQGNRFGAAARGALRCFQGSGGDRRREPNAS